MAMMQCKMLNLRGSKMRKNLDPLRRFKSQTKLPGYLKHQQLTSSWEGSTINNLLRDAR